MTDKDYGKVGLLVLGAICFVFAGLMFVSVPWALGFVGAVCLALAFGYVSMVRDKDNQ